MKTRKRKTLELVQLSILIALVVVLQIVSAIIPPIGGMVSITLTLVPVVIGAILFGKRGGAILGFAFGIIVLINCIIALDKGGNILWVENPLFTAGICIIKGTAAGFVPAVVYKLAIGTLKNPSAGRKYVASLLAAISAPIVNTGLFVCGMLLFFTNTLTSWAGKSDVLTYIILTLAGLNFIVELIINIILAPAIARIVDILNKKVK